ncbi:hypothetical protein [uncultured Halopseudomonas sp.]|uniref:hypothetical protein n=1 Tax=uncultured Halopseudomonas sp. TaxID=2901193 RepID=UPI0030EDE5E1|tara:strand:+ start:55796 stop:56230 length:435 start_codon:yes stop_codon:yes gene_type:complete
MTMKRIELIRQSVDQHLSDIHDLLAMRLLFPPVQIVVPVEKEIQDLYLYPERLETSYRDEWKAIALKAIHKHGFADESQTDLDNLDQYLGVLLEKSIPQCIQNHPSLFHTLDEILAIQGSNNTITFPDPRRQALMRLIWPERQD